MLPFNQSVLPIVQDASFVYGAISVVILIALIFATKSGARWLSFFGVVWMVVFLAPSMLQNESSGVQLLLEHRMYVPSFGFILILVHSRLLADFRFGDRKQSAVLAALLVVYAGLVVRHQENFRDAKRFWDSAARTSPHSAVAQFNLGATYQRAGDPEQAEALCHRALELDPKQPRIQNNLGLLYVARGQYWHAIHAFEREIELSPLIPDSYFNLAMAKFDQRGRVVDEEILALVMRTLELSPHSSHAREFLVKHQARIEESMKSDDG